MALTTFFSDPLTLSGANTVIAARAAGTTTPDEVEPMWDAPWMDLFTTTQGMIMATLLGLCAILGVLGAGLWGAGKFGSSGRAQEWGLPLVGISLVSAVLIAVIGSAIMWGSGEAENWFDF